LVGVTHGQHDHVHQLTHYMVDTSGSFHQQLSRHHHHHHHYYQMRQETWPRTDEVCSNASFLLSLLATNECIVQILTTYSPNFQNVVVVVVDVFVSVTASVAKTLIRHLTCFLLLTSLLQGISVRRIY